MKWHFVCHYPFLKAASGSLKDEIVDSKPCIKKEYPLVSWFELMFTMHCTYSVFIHSFVSGGRENKIIDTQ